MCCGYALNSYRQDYKMCTWFPFALFCSHWYQVLWINVLHLPVFFRVTSLELGQPHDCSSDNELALNWYLTTTFQWNHMNIKVSQSTTNCLFNSSVRLMKNKKNQSSALQTLYAENPPVSSWFPTQRASNLLNHVMSCHDHSTKHNKSPTLSIFLLMYSMSYCHSLWKVHQWPVDSPHKGPVMWKLSCCDIIIHKPETQSIFLGMYSMSYCHSLWKVHLWWSGNQQCGCWHYESHYNRMQHMIWWGLLHVTWQVGFHGDSSQLGLRPHLANDFSITIQTSFFQIPTKWSLQNFAHAMTVVLSWHVQNFVVIWWPRMELQQNEISPEMHCDGTIVKWDRLQTLLHWQLKCYALKNSAFISTFWAAFINA